MTRPTGRVRLWRNGLLFCERNNLVVNAGLPAMAEQIAGGNGYQVAAVGFGSGATAPTVYDTDLGAAPKYYNAVGAATYPSPGTVQFAFAIQAADYAAYGMTIQEIGLFANAAEAVLPATAGFSYPAWSASSNQPVGNLVASTAGNPFRSTTPPAWPASTAVAVGRLITDSNGNLQECTTAGTTGASHPTWATTVNSTTTDNTATWTCKGLAGYTPVTGSSTPTWNTAAIGDLTYDGTVVWTYLAALVVPQPMIAHAVVPAFSFSGAAAYSGTWSLTF
jgi:hypothetical protein